MYHFLSYMELKMIFIRVVFVFLTAMIVYLAASLDMINNNYWVLNAAILSSWYLFYFFFIDKAIKNKFFSAGLNS